MLTEDKYWIDLSKEQELLRDKTKSIDMIDVSLAGYRFRSKQFKDNQKLESNEIVLYTPEVPQQWVASFGLYMDCSVKW